VPISVPGSDVSVGASGGWLQGGGHSMLSASLGLGVDRVVGLLLPGRQILWTLTKNS